MAKQINELQITALRWTDSYGNTYHSTKVWVNDEILIREYEYGYGEHYLETARQLLVDNGYWHQDDTIKGYTTASRYDWYEYIRENNILHSARDVKRKKDMLNF